METMNSYNLVEHINDLAVAHDAPRGFESAAIMGVKLGAMKPGDVYTVVMGRGVSPTVVMRPLTVDTLCEFETVGLAVTKTRKVDEYTVTRIR